MHVKKLPTMMAGLMVATMASVASAATVDRQKFEGSQVATSFSVDTVITCADGTAGAVFASGFISGSQTVTKQQGSPKVVSDGIFVQVDAYSNSCTGTLFGFAAGGISGGFVSPNNNLSSSRLAGTAELQDFGTGAILTVVLDVAVQGTGTIFATQASTKTKTVESPGGPFTMTIARSAAASREGTASGSISIEGFVLQPTFFGTTLERNASSTITIEK